MRTVGREVLQQQIGIPENSGEQVIEIMGDSSGKAPDRFHFLRLTQLVFESLALGHLAQQVCICGSEVSGSFGDQGFEMIAMFPELILEQLAVGDIADRDYFSAGPPIPIPQPLSPE